MNTMNQSLLAITAAILAALAIGLAGSDGSLMAGGIPLFLLCGVWAFAVQWMAFLPAWWLKTEHFFDLTGSLTYLSLALGVLYVTGVRDIRGLVIAVAVTIWALRLGVFLFRRVRVAGEDRRFRDIKTRFSVFLMTWTLQGLWVFLTFSAGLAALTSERTVPVDGALVSGLLLWGAGFTLEVVADRQKSRFRSDPENRNRFIDQGVWSWSRHPNYLGEIILWSGIAVIALPVLSGWQYLTLVSPLFVILLLTRISGIPMLEASARKKWGADPDYQAYCERTPVLVPFRLL